MNSCYFAAKQRTAQVNYLAEHHQECIARNQSPSPEGGEEQFASLAETSRAIYCGDFNLTVDSDDYQTMTGRVAGSEINNGKPALVDCWRHVYGNKPHDPTCGMYDRVQWQEGPHCRDFFFASPDVAEHVSSISVETSTAASDHQPLKITIDVV